MIKTEEHADEIYIYDTDGSARLGDYLQTFITPSFGLSPSFSFTFSPARVMIGLTRSS